MARRLDDIEVPGAQILSNAAPIPTLAPLLPILGLIGGLAAWLAALPGRPLPLLMLIALAPLYALGRRLSPSRALVVAWVWGIACWLGTLGDSFAAARSMTGLSVPASAAAALALAAYQAIPLGLAAWLTVKLGWLRGWRGALAFAALWTLALSLFPAFFTGSPAHAFYRFPALLQITEIGGTPLLLFVVLLVNALIAEAALATLAPRRFAAIIAPLLAAAGLLAVVLAYGSWRLDRLHDEQAAAGSERFLTIGAIEPHIPVAYPRDGRFLQHQKEDLDRLLDLGAALVAAAPPLDLMIWPEQPISITTEMRDRIAAIAALARRAAAPILVPGAAPSTASFLNGNTGRLSRVFDFGADGNIATSYDKLLLIPFVENLPGEERWPWLRRLVSFPNNYVAGAGPRLFSVGAARVIPALCYESLFIGHLRRFTDLGGNLLANPSDDAWFGGPQVAELHFAVALMNATSLRLPLAYIENAGPSTLVEATGEAALTARRAVNGGRWLVARLYVPASRSPYAAFGDVFLFLLALGVAVAPKIMR